MAGYYSGLMAGVVLAVAIGALLLGAYIQQHCVTVLDLLVCR
jgi:hypothetical protein